MAQRTVTTFGANGQQIDQRLVDIPLAESNRDDVEAKARAALAANVTYLAIVNPTAAQQRAQIDRLTRETSALIRLMLGELEDTAGT